MNCQEVRELLPAYVLGALENDEVDAIEAHLKAGREHDDELVDLRVTVFAMDRYADEQSLEVGEAPRRSWLSRLLERTDTAEPRGQRALPPIWGLGLAAALLVAIFASGWLIARTTGGAGGQEVAVSVQGQAGQLVSLKGTTSRDGVYVTMSGWQRLPEGSVYQIWAIRGGEWERIGVCNPDANGHWEGEFRFRISPAEQIAVTIEPAGGSDHPTTTPIITSST